MGQGGTGLQEAERAFRDWRRTKRPGDPRPIPRELWELAVGVASSYGPTKTAQRLRLNYRELKLRCEAQAGSADGFVEVAPRELSLAGEAVVEVEDARGRRVRLVLRGLSAAEVTAAAKELWSIAR